MLFFQGSFHFFDFLAFSWRIFQALIPVTSSHGRDNTLRIWQLRASDELTLSAVLPAEDATTPRPKPWLLYTLPVNTLNFCAFSLCSVGPNDDPGKAVGASSDAVLVATPSTDDKKINIYQFPDEKLKYVVPKISTTDSGEYFIRHLHPNRPLQNSRRFN